MTRQGAEAHWLYVLEDGEGRCVAEGGVEEEVGAAARATSFFGEMSLMTGEPRAATVMAVTDCECFRLDKATFQEGAAQPACSVAEQVAAVLTRRRAELLAVREGVTAEAKLRQLAGSQTDFAVGAHIRDFFGLEKMSMSALLLALLSSQAPADAWTVVSKDDGVTLESRPVKDSDYLEYRATADTDVPGPRSCATASSTGAR